MGVDRSTSEHRSRVSVCVRVATAASEWAASVVRAASFIPPGVFEMDEM